MADQYPWGSQSPQARLSKLQNALTSSERSRDRALEKHKEKMAKFDEADRQTKADIKQCQQIIDKEQQEANANSLTKLMMKMLSSSSAEAVQEALKNGTLEGKLASITTDLESPDSAAAKDGKKSAVDASASA